MRTAHVFAVLACLIPLAQDDEPSLEQEVAALIERTNALESFRLVYEMESSRDGVTESGSIEIAYRAPDLGRVRMSQGSSESDLVFLGDRIYQYTSDRGWRRARYVEPPTCTLAHERFPPAVQRIDAGVSFLLRVGRDDKNEPGVGVHVAQKVGGRTHLLAWLEELQHAQQVSRQPGAFEWEEEGTRKRLSRQTGMLEELTFSPSEGRIDIRLRSEEVDIELPRELVDLPDEVRDLPEDLELLQSFSMSPSEVRGAAFVRAEEWLGREGHTLDDSSRANWRAVMDVLHRERIAGIHESIADHLRPQFEERARSVVEELSRDASEKRRAELEEKVRARRASLEGRLAELLEKDQKLLPAIEALDQPALLEIELEVIAELFAELVSGPILARYDEVMAAALER